MIFQAGWLSKRRASRNYGSLPIDFSELESERNMFYSGFWGQPTLKDERDIMSETVNIAAEKILAKLQSQHKEVIGKFDSLEEADQEIKRLQQQLNAKTQLISDLIIARKNTKRIYYVGLFAGITSSIGGAVFNNLLYLIVGVGITLTTITGLWDAKQNEW